MAKINEIIVSIESRVESCQARIDSVGRDVSSLAGDVRTVLDWILHRFGNEEESWNLRERIRQMSTVDAVNTSNSSSSCVTSSRDSSGNIVIEISNNNLQAVPTVKQECVVFDTSTSSDFVENHLEDHVEELYHSDRSSNDENRAEDGQNVPTDVNESFTEPAATSTPNTSSVGTRRGRPNRQASQQNKEPQATQCDQCGKILKDSSSLRQHKATHKDVRPFVCSECGKAFRRKFHLKTHTLIHTGEKKHQCGYCGKLFLLPKDLVAHERIHTGERPYSCHLCPKSFNLKSHLKMHVRTHTGEKPYQCDICKKSFSQSNSLRVHKKVHLRQQTTAARNPAAQPVDIPDEVVASSSSRIVIVTEQVGDNGAEGVLPIRLVHVSSAESSMTDA